MQQLDMIIIGGGISGLSMAWYSQQAGLSTLLLEQQASVGGLFDSRQAPEQTKDFWLELGTHSCFNSYQHLLDIMEHCQLLPQVQKKQVSTFRLWRDGQLLKIPSQLRWGHLMLSMPRLFVTQKHGLSVRDYYQRIFSKANYEAVLRHAFNAVICQAADQFPADLLFRKRKRRKDVIKSFTMPQGIQQIALNFAQQLTQHQVDIQISTTVQAIQPLDKGFQVETSSGEQMQCRYLVLATPVTDAAQLLQGYSPALAESLAKIRTASVESVAVVVPHNALKLQPLAGIIGIDAPFYSVVSRDYLPDEQYRGFTFHFKPQQLDETQQQQLIAQVLGVSPEQFIWSARKTNTLPALDMEHYQVLMDIGSALNDLPLGLTGNYLMGVSVEDCVSRSWQEFQRLQQLG